MPMMPQMGQMGQTGGGQPSMMGMMQGQMQQATTQAGAQLEKVEGERAGQLAKVLGMHPDFASDVQERGMDALIDRLEQSDSSGVRAAIVRVFQALGGWLEQSAAGGKPPDQQTILAAAGKLAEQFQLPPEIIQELAMDVLRIMGEATAKMGGQGNAATT